MDVLQPVLLHLGDRPLHGTLKLGRAAQAIADDVGQQRQPLPAERIRNRGAHQPRCRLAVLVEP